VTPTPEAVALIRDALVDAGLSNPHDSWRCEYPNHGEPICDLTSEAANVLAHPPLAAALELGVAWQAVVAALPEHARGPALYSVWLTGRTSWAAEAYGTDTTYVGAPTPVDALRALTAKLLEAKP